MQKKLVSGIMLTLLFIGTLTLAFSVQTVKSEPTTWTVDDDGPADFHTIQEAIDGANDGDVVFVRAGTYHEHVVVNKAVSLAGENKKTTIIDGDYRGIVVQVTANRVSISSFTIRNSGMWFPNGDSGIRLRASHCNIINNEIIYNESVGVMLRSSSYNFICGNNITANGWVGVDIHSSSNNHISGNNIRANYDYGIHLYFSFYNFIAGNNITANRCYGISQFSSSYNKISGNNITANKWSGFYLEQSPNNFISGNNITANEWEGIELYWSSNNKISGNNIESNRNGIVPQFSLNILISGNNISTNVCGIFIAMASNSYIYHNNFFDNTVQVKSLFCANTWDDGYPSGGNYWSDYKERYPEAKELDGSGIWDTPYFIDGNNQDNYPLMESWTQTPMEAVQELIETVNIWNLRRGMENSLTSKLGDVFIFWI